MIGGYSYGEHVSVTQRSIIYSNANEQYTPALDVSSYVDKTKASTQPSYSPIPPPTPASTTMAPESTQSPATDTPEGETQPSSEPFPTATVAAVSTAIAVVVVAGLLVYVRRRGKQ